MRLRTIVAILLVTTAFSHRGAAADDPSDNAPGRTSLRTVEGEVVAVASLPAEGDLPVVAVTLQTTKPDDQRLEILLAPERVLKDIAFDVAEGDVLRARIFVTDRSPSKVHRVMNLSRGTMVRFRTLRKVPLWSAAGEWDGGPCRRRAGAGGGGHRHGRGPRR